MRDVKKEIIRRPGEERTRIALTMRDVKLLNAGSDGMQELVLP